MKPLADFVIAILLLLITLPVMLLSAILIKLIPKGLLFSSRNGTERMESNLTFIIQNDAYRRTEVWFRQRPAMIRELQGWAEYCARRVWMSCRSCSTLLKDMSFIGPRPEMKRIVEECYTDLERRRFLVKPGITGLW